LNDGVFDVEEFGYFIFTEHKFVFVVTQSATKKDQRFTKKILASSGLQ
jgi:hypothetical protein